MGSRSLLLLWFQVRTLWLLIWWPLEAYMIVNFRAREISRGARKLARTPTLKKKKKEKVPSKEKTQREKETGDIHSHRSQFKVDYPPTVSCFGEWWAVKEPGNYGLERRSRFASNAECTTSAPARNWWWFPMRDHVYRRHAWCDGVIAFLLFIIIIKVLPYFGICHSKMATFKDPRP